MSSVIYRKAQLFCTLPLITDSFVVMIEKGKSPNLGLIVTLSLRGLEDAPNLIRLLLESKYELFGMLHF